MSRNMANKNIAEDVFSWEKMRLILDEKLHDVAKKEDLQTIKAEMEELRAENMQLKNEINKLNTRIEAIDRRSRSSNIVVKGLKCNNIQSAKNEFLKICTDILNININVWPTKVIAKGKAFIFNLESKLDAQKVLYAKEKLKGKDIYIQKDYTVDEQRIRYNLRQISKKINKNKKGINVRLGELCIYVDNRKYSWSNGKIISYSGQDASFLNNLLAECNFAADIDVRDLNTNVRQNQ